MTHPAMQHSPRHQLLALGLAAVITAGLLSGLVGLAANDQQAQLAQHLQQRSQALNTVTTGHAVAQRPAA
jgi:hypothetical protein